MKIIVEQHRNKYKAVVIFCGDCMFKIIHIISIEFSDCRYWAIS